MAAAMVTMPGEGVTHMPLVVPIRGIVGSLQRPPVSVAMKRREAASQSGSRAKEGGEDDSLSSSSSSVSASASAVSVGSFSNGGSAAAAAADSRAAAPGTSLSVDRIEATGRRLGS